MEKAPAGMTGNFSMLFLMVLGRFSEKKSAYSNTSTILLSIIVFFLSLFGTA